MSHDPFSLNEHFRRTIEFPDPWMRVEGLRTARQAIEDQLTFLRDQRAVQMRALLSRIGDRIHPDDREDKVAEHQKVVNELFPKVMRGGFVISLWSVFEASVKNIAEYVRKQKGLPFGLQELRAGDFLAQMELFFERVLGLKAFPTGVEREELARLKGLRNTLAHHDGSAVALPKSLRCQTAAEYSQVGLLLFSDLHHEYVVPAEEYAADSLELVASYLLDLSERTYKAVHPTPLTD